MLRGGSFQPLVQFVRLALLPVVFDFDRGMDNAILQQKSSSRCLDSLLLGFGNPFICHEVRREDVRGAVECPDVCIVNLSNVRESR